MDKLTKQQYESAINMMRQLGLNDDEILKLVMLNVMHKIKLEEAYTLIKIDKEHSRIIENVKILRK